MVKKHWKMEITPLLTPLPLINPLHFVFNFSDIAMDWSDHAMWWPEKNIWLDKTRWTLDQYNITADAVIHFTPMHKTLRIQLPDLRFIDCQVDFRYVILFQFLVKFNHFYWIDVMANK